MPDVHHLKFRKILKGSWDIALWYLSSCDISYSIWNIIIKILFFRKVQLCETIHAFPKIAAEVTEEDHGLLRKPLSGKNVQRKNGPRRT